MRPSDPLQQQQPDELMIDWGSVPAGAVASIYWPQVNAADVVAMADSMYATHTLAASEQHTVTCKVIGGVSYIPIPRGTGENFAGLFTLDLPQSVRTGQEFDVLVRRISTKSVRDVVIGTPTHALPSEVPLEEPKPGRRRGQTVEKQVAPSEEPGLTVWRYVVGTFAVSIPVATPETMLAPEENTLAILRWRLGLMSPANRWYKVLERYTDLVAARVDGLGGDSTTVQPSPSGVPPRPKRHPGRKTHEYEGKVCEVRYDCFGDFAGFVLSCCDEERTFASCHQGIERVALLARRHQLTVVLVTETDHDERADRIVRLTLR